MVFRVIKQWVSSSKTSEQNCYSTPVHTDQAFTEHRWRFSETACGQKIKNVEYRGNCKYTCKYFGRLRPAIGNTEVMSVRYQLLLLLYFFFFPFSFSSFLLSLSLSQVGIFRAKKIYFTDSWLEKHLVTNFLHSVYSEDHHYNVSPCSFGNFSDTFVQRKV